MAGWFGPRENCGCCEQRCPCLYGSFSARRFVNTPTVRIVISDLLDEFEWQNTRFAFNPFAFVDKYKYSGIASLAGTYFFELQKNADGCIDQTANTSESQGIGSITTEVTRQLTNFNTCVTSGAPTVSSETRTAGLQVATQWGYNNPIGGSPCPHILISLFESLSVGSFRTLGLFANSTTTCVQDYNLLPFNNQCHENYLFANSGRIRTYFILSDMTSCGGDSVVDIDWGAFTVTIEDL